MNRKYYYKHCGSLHPLDPEQIEVEGDEIIGKPALVVCPVCMNSYWLIRVRLTVRYLDIDE